MFDSVPLFFAIIPAIIAVGFVTMPVIVLVAALRTRSRQRNWTPATAVLKRVSQQQRGDRDSRHSVLIGHYEYRDTNGQTHTGQGDLGSQGMPVGEAQPTVDILFDPLDPTRSMVSNPGGTQGMACLVPVMVFFGAIGVIILSVMATAVLSR